MSFTLEDAGRRVYEDAKVGFDRDRSLTVGSSEIGACARMVAMEKANIELDEGETDDDFGFFWRGNIMEDYVTMPLAKSWVETHGGELLFAGQEDQISFNAEESGVSCTPDGLAIGLKSTALKPWGVARLPKGGEVAFEFKSIDPRTNMTKLPKRQHIEQLHLAMGLFRATEIEGTTYKPGYGLIVYQNASNYQDVRAFVVKYDHKWFKNQVARAGQIIAAARGGLKKINMLRPEGKLVSGGCTYCKRQSKCTGYAALVPMQSKDKGDLDDATKKSLEEKGAALREAKVAKDTADERLKASEGDLKEALSAARVRFYDGNGFTAKWTTVKGRETFDQKLAKATLQSAGHDLAKFTKTGAPGERLSVEITG